MTLLQVDRGAPLGGSSAPRLLALAGRDSRRRGLISARSMGTVSAWVRPDDRVLHDLVDDGLMGEDPPVSAILAGNDDGTSLPARLHEPLGTSRENSLTRSGGVSVLGAPVDLSRIDVPTFVTGAVNDQPTPWTGCSRTTGLLSGPSTFVPSAAGHIASLINPPGGPDASYWVGGEAGPDAAAWREGAQRRAGSRREAWSASVLERSGETTDAPAGLGSERHPPLEPAPGAYVLDREPVSERVSSGPSGRRP